MRSAGSTASIVTTCASCCIGPRIGFGRFISESSGDGQALASRSSKAAKREFAAMAVVSTWWEQTHATSPGRVVPLGACRNHPHIIL